MPKKVHFVLVRVSAPENLTSQQVRREVRTLINEQCNYSAEEGDIRAAKVSAVPASWVGK